MLNGLNVPTRFANLTGFVLAGGGSKRMGRLKQDLALGGEPMLSRQIGLLKSLCGRVGIVGGPKPRNEESDFFCEDEWPGRGPLGGIFSGLARTRTEYNLFVGCDMPFLTPAFLRYLSARTMAECASVTAPEASDLRVQPLCAIYRRGARAVIRMSLMRDANKTSGFYSRVCCLIVRWREISRAGFRPDIFTNVNTPADYEAAGKSMELKL
ncbi:MAG TPA: molybdenum cofactor guanylyltransferase [Terriglobia bacterium]|nr:molybdenum cofactor guanylyltransferase [Terriglobia bacterium]